MKLYRLLEELEACGDARNSKLEILEANKGYKPLEDYLCKHSYYRVYGVRVRPDTDLLSPARNASGDIADTKRRWGGFLQLLDDLEARNLTGFDAKEAIAKHLKQTTPVEFKWHVRALNRDNRLKLRYGELSKVWPTEIQGVAPHEQWLGCQLALDIKHVKPEARRWPMSVEPKLDGIRMLFCSHQGVCRGVTRGGRYYPTTRWIEEEVLANPSLEGMVLDGELFWRSWNDTSSLAKRTKIDKQTDKLLKNELVLVAFDLLTLAEYTEGRSARTYLERRKEMKAALADMSRVLPIPMLKVSDMDQATELYNDWLLKGVELREGLVLPVEGIMLKNRSAGYSRERTADWLKVKPFATITVKVLDTIEGSKGTRTEGMLGAFVVELPDGNVTKASGELTDVIRREVWADRQSWVGKLLDCKVQQDKASVAVARFPVVQRKGGKLVVRDDVSWREVKATFSKQNS